MAGKYLTFEQLVSLVGPSEETVATVLVSSELSLTEPS